MFDCQSNIALIIEALDKLKELSNEMVFVGGCTIALYIDDISSIKSDIRPTTDVDVIIEVATKFDWHLLERKLMSLGFSQSLNVADDPICRWRNGTLILDVMPFDETVLGFSNRWYKEGFAQRRTQVVEGRNIFVLPAPILLCTKVEAYKNRGKGSLNYSKDAEDIAALLCGRENLISEIGAASTGVRDFLRSDLLPIIRGELFDEVIAALIPQDRKYSERVLNAVSLKMKIVDSLRVV